MESQSLTSSAPKRKSAKPRKITPTVMELVSTGALEDLKESIAVEEIKTATTNPIDNNDSAIVGKADSSDEDDEEMDFLPPVMLLAQPPEVMPDHVDNNAFTILSIPTETHDDSEPSMINKVSPLQAEILSAPPKRKRGRPRKTPKTDISIKSQNQIVSQVVKFSKEQNTTEADPKSPDDAPKKRRGRPRKRPLDNEVVAPAPAEKPNIEKSAPIETDSPAPKRRRGRPRKNPLPVEQPAQKTSDTPQDNDKQEYQESTTTDLNDNPSLHSDTEEASKEPEIDEAVKKDNSTTKRKRGRPRKNPPPAESLDSSPKKDQSTMNRSSHSEPALNSISGESGDQEMAAIPVKRGRGRPRKQPKQPPKSSTNQVRLTETSTSAPKKRGRPKKNTPKDEFPVVIPNLEPQKSLDEPAPSYLSVKTQPSFQLVMSSSSDESEDFVATEVTTDRQSSPLLDDRFVASSDED